MPVNGLPLTLDSIINTILMESKLSSYKIAANDHRTTVVLRFDSTDSTPDTKNCDRNTRPVCHTKPPTTSFQERRVHCGNCRTSTAETTDQPRTISPIDFHASTKTTSSAIFDSLQSDSAISLSRQSGGVSSTPNSLLPDVYTQSTRSTHLDSTSFIPTNLAVCTGSRPAGDLTNKKLTTIECRPPARPLHASSNSLLNVSTNSCSNHVSDKEKAICDEPNNDNTDHDSSVTDSGDSESESCSTSDVDSEEKFDEFLDCNAILTKMIECKPDLCKLTQQQDRNVSFDKLLQERWTSIIFARTDDLIVEYCPTQKKLLDVIFKGIRPGGGRRQRPLGYETETHATVAR